MSCCPSKNQGMGSIDVSINNSDVNAKAKTNDMCKIIKRSPATVIRSRSYRERARLLFSDSVVVCSIAKHMNP